MPDETSRPIPTESGCGVTGTGVLPVHGPKAPIRLRPRSPLGALLVVALIGFIGDQACKAWAFAPPVGLSQPREIAPGLVAGILATNDGAMANLAGGRPMTAVVCALNALGLFVLATWSAYQRPMLWQWHDAVFGGLLSAGMLGNAADRLAFGYVRDFLVAAPLPHWIFNLADVFIVLGTLLLLGSWAASRLRRSTEAQGDPDRPQALPTAIAGA
jgi:lipoprotein signal peptidase